MYVQCDLAFNWVDVKDFDSGVFQNIIQMPYLMTCILFARCLSTKTVCFHIHPLNSSSLDSLKVSNLSDKYVTVQVTFCTINSCLPIDVCLYNL
jgi:hypothetical protein